MGEVLGQAHAPATIWRVDLALLDDTLAAAGEPAFRARQVWRWTADGARGYEEMTDLPAALRERLAAEVPFSSLDLVDEAHASDGTVKALFHTHDGRAVEAVLMRYRDGRRSVCVSSQSGLPADLHVLRHRRDEVRPQPDRLEILDQVLHFRRIEPVDHLVFMGMGEPMMNLDHVLDAARRLPDVGITHRRTTISTVGWVPGIDRAGASATCRSGLALLAARARGRAALADHAGQRPLPARGGARRVRGATTSAAAARCSSST